MEASAKDATPKERRRRRWKRRLTIAGLLLLAGVLIAASVAILDTISPEDVPANFTRVAGPTRVETALEAGRFWLEPPKHVFRTKATARGDIILRAAECAMTYDAPLLFMPATPRGKRRIHRLVERWGEPQVHDVITTGGCVPKEAVGTPLHRLDGQDHLLAERDRRYVSSVETQPDLESTVVFAASKATRSPADVAVALTLAAHLAKSRAVSVVLLPRHLGADPGLDRQLRDRSDLVTGGVVVGGEKAVGEDTRLVLRQLLRSTNRGSFIAGVRTGLGDLAALFAAIVALLAGGAAAATATAPLVVRVTNTVWEERPMKRSGPIWDRQRHQEPGSPLKSQETPRSEQGDDPTSSPGAAATSTSGTEQQTERLNPFEVDDADRPSVTLWLPGGRRVSGVYQGEVAIGPATFIKLRGTHISAGGPEEPSYAEVVLVPVMQVELAASRLIAEPEGADS